MSLSSQIVTSIPRPSTGEEIVVSLMRRGTARYVDMRVFSATRSSKGEPRPTNAGLCVRTDQIYDLIAALQAAEAMP